MKINQYIKNKLDRCIDELAESLDKYVVQPGKDFSRNRKLGFVDTVKLLLTMKGNTLRAELYEFLKRTGIRLTPSALVQQRSKIKSNAFEELFHSFNRVCTDNKTFRGYRLLAMDGTDINIYFDPTSCTYVTSYDGHKGHNQYHLNGLYDLKNNVYLDCLLQPRPNMDEKDALIRILENMRIDEKVIMEFDRGFESQNCIAHLNETPNIEYIMRVRQGKSCMSEIANLPMCELDKDISYTITTTQTKEDKEKGYRLIQTKSKKGKVNNPKTTRRWDFGSPYLLEFRVVRFKLSTGEYETIVTSLDRKEFPSHVIKQLYNMRWGIETSFRELKYSIGLVNLHSKKDELIRQEIFAGLIMYNFCERIAMSVVIEQKTSNTYIYQVHFTMAIRICLDFFAYGSKYHLDVVDEIKRHILPIIPGRRRLSNCIVRPKQSISFLYRVAA